MRREAALKSRKEAYVHGKALVGETDDRLPKQRFPPAVVRLDNEQLQFHHIRGGGPRHKNESVHVIKAFLSAKIHLHLVTLSPPRRWKRNSVLFRSRLVARDPIIRVRVCIIDQSERNTRNRSERRRSLSLPTTERKKKKKEMRY